MVESWGRLISVRRVRISGYAFPKCAQQAAISTPTSFFLDFVVVIASFSPKHLWQGYHRVFLLLWASFGPMMSLWSAATFFWNRRRRFAASGGRMGVVVSAAMRLWWYLPEISVSRILPSPLSRYPIRRHREGGVMILVCGCWYEVYFGSVVESWGGLISVRRVRISGYAFPKMSSAGRNFDPASESHFHSIF